MALAVLNLETIEKELDAFVRDFLTMQRGTEALLHYRRLLALLKKRAGKYPTLDTLAEHYAKSTPLLFFFVMQALRRMYDGLVIIDYRGRKWKMLKRVKIVSEMKTLVFRRLEH